MSITLYLYSTFKTIFLLIKFTVKILKNLIIFQKYSANEIQELINNLERIEENKKKFLNQY